MDFLDNGITHVVSAVFGVLVTAAGGVVFAARWVLALVTRERDERTKADDDLWEAIKEHRQEEVEYERRVSDKMDGLATKADLKQQTDLILAAMTIRGRAAE